MNETGQDERGPVPTGSDDVPPGIDLLPGVREQPATRRRHWPRRMRVLVAAAAVAAVPGVTGTLIGASASHAPSALAAVTGALTKTSAQSYRFSLASTTQFAGRELQSSVVSGAFDPGHELGTELLTTRSQQRSARAQIRFVGKYVYTWISPGSGMETIARPWNKAPAPPAGPVAMLGVDPYGFVSDRPVSLAGLSVVLRSARTVRDEGPASGPGWTGTKYAFSARNSEWPESVSAIVYVDQQGRVRRLVMITAQGKLTRNRDLTFGDFGAPVPVTAPPASQAEYTSTPYWGFYF